MARSGMGRGREVRSITIPADPNGQVWYGKGKGGEYFVTAHPE
jgi:hypothetical protein